MGKNHRNGRKELPLTAILAAVVAVLVIVLGFVVWGVVRMEQTGERGERSGPTETLETGTEQMDEKPDVNGTDGRQQEDAKRTDEAAKTGADDSDGKQSENVKRTDEDSQTDAEDADRKQQEDAKRADEESETDAVGTDDNQGKGAERTDNDAETDSIGIQIESEESESETEPEEKLVVAIDPGHQGSWVNMSDTEPLGPGSSEMKAKSSVGTQSRFTGKPEYELTLEVSLLLRTELESRGYEVIMTREDHDKAISNSERALMAYDEGGDIYVRIHANGSDDSSVSGALAMVPSPQNAFVGNLASDSYTLADCILNHYCSTASFASLGIQYYDNMTGINWSRLPVMILEMGFMTNQSDDSRMADPAVQQLMAEGIADGIDEYFTKKGMKSKEVSPEAKAKLDTLLEIAGESYVYPAQDQGEEWAVSIADLASGASGDLNGDVPMKSASVIKAFVLAAVYDRVCYPSSSERQLYIEETHDGELKELLTAMITVSDNDAANTLVTRLGGGDAQAGMAVVNQFCEENGYDATHMGRLFLAENPSDDNVTSANDCRDLLASIYSGTCVNAEASAKMYEYFRNQTRTGKIPAGLAGTTASAANKTGELAGEYGQYVENDIAVIEDGDSAYVLCVLSGSLQDNGAAQERIAALSKAVYESWSGAVHVS